MRICLLLAVTVGLTLAANPAGPEIVARRGLRAGEMVIAPFGVTGTDGPEETLHFDGPNDDGMGLNRGGTFYGAARFTPSLPCSLMAILFYHSDPSHDAEVLVWGQGTDTTPGSGRDSAPYTGAETGWRRVELGTPLYLEPDVDFWAGVRCTHDSDFFPLGIDAGPMVSRRGGFFSPNGGWWMQMTQLGMNVNMNVRAIVAPASFAHDIGIARIISPYGFSESPLIRPVVLVKNYGREATMANVRLWIEPDGYVSEATVRLESGDTQSLTFTDWEPASGGFYTVCCSLAPDENPANNRRTAFALRPDFTEQFEANNGRYASDCWPEPGWVWGIPGSPRPAPRSGAKVWSGPLTGDYADEADWNLYSRVHRATVDSPAVAFYHWYRCERGTDGGNFSYSLDTGRTWRLLAPWADYSAPYDEFVYSLGAQGYTGNRPTSWTPAVFRLPVGNGTPFQLRWHFTSDGSTGGPGWEIDDVSGIGVEPPSGVAEGSAGRQLPSLSVTPNPASGAAVIRYALMNPGRFSLRLHDVGGRLRAVLADGVGVTSSYSIPVATGLLSRGVYLLMLESGGARATEKLIVE